MPGPFDTPRPPSQSYSPIEIEDERDIVLQFVKLEQRLASQQNEIEQLRRALGGMSSSNSSLLRINWQDGISPMFEIDEGSGGGTDSCFWAWLLPLSPQEVALPASWEEVVWDDGTWIALEDGRVGTADAYSHLNWEKYRSHDPVRMCQLVDHGGEPVNVFHPPQAKPSDSDSDYVETGDDGSNVSSVVKGTTWTRGEDGKGAILYSTSRVVYDGTFYGMGCKIYIDAAGSVEKIEKEVQYTITGTIPCPTPDP